jgi:hypothetical protein
MPKSDTWEIDPTQWVLDDVIAVQEAGEALKAGGAAGLKQIRAVLGRLVTNKTEEEIGRTPLTDLSQRLDELSEAIDELMSTPKASATP